MKSSAHSAYLEHMLKWVAVVTVLVVTISSGPGTVAGKEPHRRGDADFSGAGPSKLQG